MRLFLFNWTLFFTSFFFIFKIVNAENNNISLLPNEINSQLRNLEIITKIISNAVISHKEIEPYNIEIVEKLESIIRMLNEITETFFNGLKDERIKNDTNSKSISIENSNVLEKIISDRVKEELKTSSKLLQSFLEPSKPTNSIEKLKASNIINSIHSSKIELKNSDSPMTVVSKNLLKNNTENTNALAGTKQKNTFSSPTVTLLKSTTINNTELSISSTFSKSTLPSNDSIVTLDIDKLRNYSKKNESMPTSNSSIWKYFSSFKSIGKSLIRSIKKLLIIVKIKNSEHTNAYDSILRQDPNLLMLHQSLVLLNEDGKNNLKSTTEFLVKYLSNRNFTVELCGLNGTINPQSLINNKSFEMKEFEKNQKYINENSNLKFDLNSDIKNFKKNINASGDILLNEKINKTNLNALSYLEKIDPNNFEPLNLYAYLGEEREVDLVLVCHIEDDLPKNNFNTFSLQPNNFSKKIKKIQYYTEYGNIYGTGVSGNKAIMAAMIHAAEKLTAEGQLPTGSLGLLFVVGNGMNGRIMEAASENLGVPWNHVIFGEPTDNRLAIGHMGQISGVLTILGSSLNFVDTISEDPNRILIKTLEEILRIPLPYSKLLGKSQFSINYISTKNLENLSGSQSQAFFTVHLSYGSFEKVLKMINRIVKNNKGVDMYIESAYDPFLSNSNVPGFKKVALTFRTDIPYFNGGRSIFIYGPGDSKAVSSQNECISCNDLFLAVKGYTKLIKYSLTRTSVF